MWISRLAILVSIRDKGLTCASLTAAVDYTSDSAQGSKSFISHFIANESIIHPSLFIQYKRSKRENITRSVIK